MIVIKVIQSNKKIVEMTLSGHAETDIRGKDLVCAGVSCIAIGLLNALDSLTPSICELQMKEGFIHILVNDEQNHDTQIILNTAMIQFKTIQEKYSQFITIDKQEV